MLLGVDGGGTKTVFLLTKPDGTVCGMHRDTSAYHVQIGMDGLTGLLARGLGEVLKQSGCTQNDISGAFVGLPALGEDSRVENQLLSLPSQVLQHDRYVCGNDMVCAWAGSLAGKDGINIVAGTGSIAYGERRGVSGRCGGWGELIGDEGSAFWIAREGLAAASRMADGRTVRGPLLDHFVQHFGVENELDLSGLVMSGPDAGRDRIAGLCGIVVAAWGDGDVTAGKILISAGHELADMVAALAKRLEFEPTEQIAVSYSGGAVTKIPELKSAMDERLSQSIQSYKLVSPAFSPSAGAIWLASRVAKSQIEASALHRVDTALSGAC